jgi:nitrogen regulatory protein PII
MPRVDVPSAGQTIVSLTLREVSETGPWPLTRVLTELGELDVERVGVARAVGDRHGIPLIHSQEVTWRGQQLFLEARHALACDELSVELPPWDELTASVDDETVWRLVDAVAVAADAQFGSIGDGEPPETRLPGDARALGEQLRRHLALLLPEWAADDVDASGGHRSRVLDGSGLVVVTP